MDNTDNQNQNTAEDDRPYQQKLETNDPSVVQQSQNTSATEDNIKTKRDEEVIAWIGPQFIAHDKSPVWYPMVLIVAVVLGGVFYLLTKDKITTTTMVVAVLLLGGYSLRKPRQINFQLDRDGVDIGPKHFYYEQFRAFVAVPEDNFANITFMPLKRFSLPVGICCSIKDEQKVLEFLSARLPYEEHHPDLVDSLMERIRF